MSAELNLRETRKGRAACRLAVAVLAAAVALVGVGCSGGGSMSGSGGSGSGPAGSTMVTLLGTSTANDQLSQFQVTVSSLTLTNQAGKTVTVVATPLNAEFMHLNGLAEPLATVNVPDDTYVSATATLGYTQLVCLTYTQVGTALYADHWVSNASPSQTTVVVPNPIIVGGAALGLNLDLMVSQSSNLNSCPVGQLGSPSLTPMFALTAVSFAASGEPVTLPELQGVVTAVSASTGSLSVTDADGANLAVTMGIGTTFQGVPGASAMASGMPVDLDAAIQPDGSLLATRIAVHDTDVTNLSVATGALAQVAAPSFIALAQQNQGFVFPQLLSGISSGQNALSGQTETWNDANTQFGISGQLANVANLPFAASLTAANMVAGQNLQVTTHAQQLVGNSGYPASTTVTLLPQTLNGTITATGTQGGFSTYTVSLANYDLEPTLATQPGQTTLLTNPGQVVVYMDGSTRMLNKYSLVAGTVQRFYGLLFNDHGTLRMDCAQVSDGVPQ